MSERASNALKIVYNSETWTTLGCVSSEDFQRLRQALLSAASAAAGQGALPLRGTGTVQVGPMRVSYEHDRETGTLTVTSVARTDAESQELSPAGWVGPKRPSTAFPDQE